MVSCSRWISALVTVVCATAGRATPMDSATAIVAAQTTSLLDLIKTSSMPSWESEPVFPLQTGAARKKPDVRPRLAGGKTHRPSLTRAYRVQLLSSGVQPHSARRTDG